jgi:transcriptional regulator with XRE-family HTH domain
MHVERLRSPASSPDRRAFGRAVRELRARQGLSLAELGRRTLVHERYLAAVEQAQVEPSLRVMVRLSDGFGVRLSVLVERYERQLARID